MKCRALSVSAAGCAATVVLALCLLAPGPAPAAPLVGTPFPLATTTGREFSFSAAFDGTNWLAGILGNALNDGAVTAQLVSQAGAMVGGRIDTGRTGSGIPAVAFDGTNYLMSWQDGAGGIYGQFIGTAGSLTGNPFEIAGTSAIVNMVGGLGYGGGYYLATYFRVGAGEARTLYARTISPAGALGEELTISTNFHKDGGNLAFDGTNFFVVWTAADNATHQGRLVNHNGTLGGEFTVNNSAAASDDPSAVAFDGTDYLVVWMDQGGTSDWDLYGQKVTTAGTLKGGVIAITEEIGPQFLGGLAFDGTNWLVVWTDLANDTSGEGSCEAGEGTCQDVYGQVLSREGTLIGPKFPIAAETGNQFGVVAGFAGGKYLTLVNLPEQLFAGLGGDVSGLFITPEYIPPPIVSAPYPIAVTPAMELGIYASFDGTNFLVGTGDMSGTGAVTAQMFSGWGSLVNSRIDTGRAGEPSAIAFDGTNHLMVWKDSAGSPLCTLYGQFVGTDGTKVGSPFEIAGTDVGSSGGLAYGGGVYLATFTRVANTPSGTRDNLYGRIIQPDGAVGSEFAISLYTEPFGVAFDGVNFLTAGSDDDDDATIKGTFVSPSGTLGAEIIIDSSSFPSDNPGGIAFDGTNYLVTWMDEVGGKGSNEWDCFGRLVAPAGTFPASKFTISDAPGAQFMPMAASGDGKWLITWNDWSKDANQNQLCDAGEGTCWDVVGRFFEADGTPAGGPFGISTGALNQFGNVIGYAGGKFLCLVNEFGTGNFGGPAGDVYGVFVAGDGISTVSIAATDATATEVGPTTGTFTVTRTGATTAELAVSYAVAGTATKGPDYSLSPATAGIVTIPAGSASATITVRPANDATPEPTETVVATLGAGTGYLLRAPTSATVSILMNDAVSLSAALDLTRTWRTGGNARWFGQKAVKHDGVDAARPDTLKHGQSSWLTTTVVGPVKVTFWWKSSSEAGDKLRFLVGTALKATRSGTGGWQQKSFLIGRGSQVLKWEFKRNAAGSAGLDTGFVDQVKIVQQ